MEVSPKPMLLDVVRQRIRLKHYSVDLHPKLTHLTI